MKKYDVLKKHAMGLAVAALMTAGMSQTALAGETVYVKATSLRYRTSAQIKNDNIVGNLTYGQKVEKVSSSNGWTTILLNGKKYYVSSQYVTATKPAASSGGAVSAASVSEQTSGGTAIALSSNYKYAEFSKINSGSAVLYRTTAANKKNKVICVNAGHGTKGGGNAKTQCHPDGSAKVTGGTTGAGATSAVAVSSGMTFADGTAESKVTLAMAKVLKTKLLNAGYDVLMIRESDDVQLDNIARTVLANNNADCHIALHWDSTSSNKGAFFMSVPSNATYRAMEPVASHWQQHNQLGESLISGLKSAGVKIYSKGSMEMDLTQTSYSTIPSVDIELGDKASDHSGATLETLANGLLAGVNTFFGQ